MCRDAAGSNLSSRGQVLQVPGVGPCLLPHEFAIFCGTLSCVEVHDARESPSALHARLAAGAGIVLCGPYGYVDAIFCYCQHYERGLVARAEVPRVAGRAQRSAAFARLRRLKLHRLLLVACGDRLLDVQDPPDTAGLQEWLEGPTGDGTFLIPLRRLQRILTDMRRAREGITIAGLDGTITIRPHVYVPSDQSVPAMFAEYRHLIAGKRVLDMGTGTGVLALLAAQLGAAEVVATDNNPKAVENARLNVERLRPEGTVQTRGPADLFASVQGEVFDVILFNAPWVKGEPRTLYDTAIYDPGYRVIDGFMQAVSGHLAPGGAILLQYSDVSQRRGENSIVHLEDILAANGLHVVTRRRIERISRVLGARERVFLFEIRRIQGDKPSIGTRANSDDRP
jgi:methylase of polypeptide subunit release factors